VSSYRDLRVQHLSRDPVRRTPAHACVRLLGVAQVYIARPTAHKTEDVECPVQATNEVTGERPSATDMRTQTRPLTNQAVPPTLVIVVV
jgi:hypothetical protein